MTYYRKILVKICKQDFYYEFDLYFRPNIGNEDNSWQKKGPKSTAVKLEMKELYFKKIYSVSLFKT